MRLPLAFLVFLSFAAVISSGCAKLSHISELLVLKDYSDSADAQEKYLKSQDHKFDLMLAAVKDGSINQYKEPRDIRKAFGDPVYIREVEKDGVAVQEWLYRYSVKYFNSEKVYLYFSQDGKFLKWEYVPADKEGVTKNVENSKE